MKIIDTNGTDVMEEIKKWEQERLQEQNKAKSRGKLYYSLYYFWNETTFCGYRTGHAITHPWIVLEEFRHELKWAYQRVFRGWDDRVVWSIDDYLAKAIPAWIEKLKKDKQGIPLNMFDDNCFNENYVPSKEGEEKAIAKWNWILDQISDGFYAYQRMDELSWDDPERKGLEEMFSNGFNLFKEHFADLWD